MEEAAYIDIAERKKEKLRMLVSDEVLIAAMRDVFNAAAREHTPGIDGSVPDEVLGQNYRAFQTAAGIINTAFTLLENYRDTQNADAAEASPH